ncbi:7TM-DISM domain-containing protein [Cellvibrio sp. PSBB023]|uniref:sensor histidine kinase n=1 Tax=Cellvibrio sp. PSBB023 TaxID=1945512 RepID=UPI0009C1C5A0|nr:7TM-DISM domain-containing protein [Cellvibrio sp. PSBB023]AQT62016.1 hypothetical protein B0D95_19295 [Cellvibrio sp. PSBB023]
MRDAPGYYRLVVVLVLLLGVSCAYAEPSPILRLDDTSARIALLPYVDYSVEYDANSSASVNDLTKIDHSFYNQLKYSRNNKMSFGYTQNVHWFRWTIDPAYSKRAEWWLQISPTFLDSATLFVPQEDGTYEPVRVGDHWPLSKRSYQGRHFLVPINLASDKLLTYYLRVQTSSTMTLGLTLWRPEAYAATVTLEDTLYGVMFGLILATVLVSMISGIWLRQPFYFLISAYLLALALAHLSLNGYDQLWFYRDQPQWSDILIGFSSYAITALTPAICIAYLAPRHYYPRINAVFVIMIVLATLGALASLLGYPKPGWVAYLSVPMLFIMMGLLCVMWRIKPVRSLLLLLLFFPSFLMVMLQLARNYALLPMNFWTTHAWPIATMIQIPYTILLVMLHLRTQEKAFLSERQKTQLHRDMLSVIAHELRTPLAVTSSALANIELQTRATHPHLLPRFQRANLGLARLGSLIDRAVFQERSLEDGVILEPRNLVVQDLFNDVAELCHVDMPHQLIMQVAPDANVLYADEHWIGHALINLVDNAIKYSPHGGTILLTAKLSDDCVVISVIDSGIGVPTNETGKLFDKFYRAKNAQDNGKLNGIGVGLFVVKTVVDAHGGTIEYQPNPGGGSIFNLYFPANV